MLLFTPFTLFRRLFRLSLHNRFQVVYIPLRVPDIVLLGTSVIFLRLFQHFDTPQLGRVQRHPHFTPHPGDLVSDENIGAQVIVPPLDGNNLTQNVGSIGVGDLDDISSTQPGGPVHKTPSLAGGIVFFQKLLLKVGHHRLAISLGRQRFKHRRESWMLVSQK